MTSLSTRIVMEPQRIRLPELCSCPCYVYSDASALWANLTFLAPLLFFFHFEFMGLEIQAQDISHDNRQRQQIFPSRRAIFLIRGSSLLLAIFSSFPRSPTKHRARSGYVMMIRHDLERKSHYVSYLVWDICVQRSNGKIGSFSYRTRA